MGEAIKDNLRCSCAVKGIDFDAQEVTTEEGIVTYEERVFVTIPWTSFNVLHGIPEKLLEGINHLKYSSVEIRYFDKDLKNEAQWIYYPDPQLPYHRVLIRSNFCTGSKGYWTETNRERTALFDKNDGKQFRHINEYAYPLNTIEKPAIMAELLSWAENHRTSGVGRWGEWQHYNSDVTVERAMEAMKTIRNC